MRRFLFTLLLVAVASIPATARASTWNAVNAPLVGLSPAASGSPSEAVIADACPASGFCVAVGTYTDDAGAREGLIETVHGSTVTPRSAPLSGLNPAPAANPAVGLERIACATTGSCAAIGTYTDQSNHTHAFAEVMSGSTWRPATLPLTGLNPAPDPASAQADLGAVTCPAAGSCVVVGDYRDASHPAVPLAEQLASGGWSAQTAPVSGLAPAGTTGSLTDVTCSQPGTCIAVGGTDGGDGDLVETLGGGGWTGSTPSFANVKPTPGRAPTGQLGGTLSNVSCSASGNCQAVGEYSDQSSEQQGLLVGLGGADTAISALNLSKVKPKPFTNPLVLFAGVDCRNGCTDVAAYTSDAGSAGTGRENLIVTPTSQFVAPLKGLSPGTMSPHGFALQRFSCPSAANCVAVGQYADQDGGADGVIESVSVPGNTASPFTPGLSAVTPNSASTRNSTLDFVSCPASGACLAVGSYIDASQTSHAMLAYRGPVVSRLAPGTGPETGANKVTISGSGFASGAAVDFGSVASPSVTFVSATKLQAVAPAGSLGTVPVSVTVSGATSLTSAGDVYTYEPPPTVTGVSPNFGSTTGGNTVTITGTGFTAHALVRFGTAQASSVVLVTPTELQVSAPAHAAGAIRVSVRTANGTSASASADHYTYDP